MSSCYFAYYSDNPVAVAFSFEKYLLKLVNYLPEGKFILSLSKKKAVHCHYQINLAWVIIIVLFLATLGTKLTSNCQATTAKQIGTLWEQIY